MGTQITPFDLWEYYTRHNARKWLGFWCMWDPNARTLIESYECIRHIALLENGLTIRHQNTNIYKDGTILDTGRRNGPWVYSRDTNCDNQGLIHPGSSNGARAVFFDNGGGTWTVLEPSKGSVFFIEIFFPHGDVRFSAGMAYNTSGELFRMTLIREDLKSQISQYWTRGDDISLGSGGTVSGVFRGEERILNAELRVQEAVKATWDGSYWSEDGIQARYGNKVYSLPDGIRVACPMNPFTSDTQNSPREESNFHISVYGIFKHKHHKELWQQTVYFKGGKFSHIKQGIYLSQA